MPSKFLVDEFSQLLRSGQKWRVFARIFLLVLLVGTVLSVLARFVFLKDDEATRPVLVVVAPLQSAEGRSLVRGASLYVEQVNREGGLSGRPIRLLSLEESAEVAREVVREPQVLGVLGHLNPIHLEAALPIYAQAGLRLVTPLAVQGRDGVVSLGILPEDEARFVANYARNILQRRLVYILREDDPAQSRVVDPVVELYRRFDTPIREQWTIAPNPSEGELDALVSKIREIDIGGLFLATSPTTAARIVHGVRKSGSMLDIMGPSTLAGNAFTEALTRLSGSDLELHAHGLLTVSPVLFDTANEAAQRFQSAYQRRFGGNPDWLATIAFDAARQTIASGPAPAAAGEPAPDASAVVPPGLLGDLEFVAGRARLPIQMGLYNGARLISAPTQLLPMNRGAGFNYIEALRQGRVLYVNDRFMYRSNVVYVGLNVHEVSEIRLDEETARVDVSIWFRFKGRFDPQDLEILNARDPITLGEPEESLSDQDFQYRRYRIKPTLRLNFTEAKRAYGQQVAGLAFRHRTLNNNNLSYVVDVLGMPAGRALADDLVARKVLAAGSGLRIDNAWVAQEVVRERGDGAPQYVAMTGEQPLFSVITLGLLLAPEGVSARDVLDIEHFFYLGIFGLVGAFAAVYLDARRPEQPLRLQTWLIRLIFWPCLLMAVGNLAVDLSFNHLSSSVNRIAVLLYESLWWVMAARLIDMAVRRFVWLPLELRTGRAIPNVVKISSSVVIYALGLAAITALVFDEPLTSLLATSGLLAMVVGLAIQANIANVFSGIVLNVERPFKVGDYIQVNDIVGRVTDITWRTTRIESNDGPAISLANALISEAQMSNLSELPHGYVAETDLHAPADVEPQQILDLLAEAIAQSEAVILKDDPIYGPRIRFLGVLSVDGIWVARFNARYRVSSLPKRDAASDQIWRHIAQEFSSRGIPLAPGALV